MKKQAVVRVPVTDIRRKPEFESERLTQIIFNEVVEIEDSEERYVQVYGTRAKEDKVFVYRNHLTKLPAIDSVKQLKKVKIPFTDVYNDDRSQLLLRLVFNTDVVVWDDDGRWSRVGTYNEPLGWVSNDDLIELPAISYSPKELVELALQFQGAPYLWGGTTPFGFDCSGFVASLFDFYDFKELRHYTGLQEKVGKTIPVSDKKIGDLLFFPGHVAMYAGDENMIHANLYDGGVALTSMDKKNPTYHPVTEDLRAVKRVL